MEVLKRLEELTVLDVFPKREVTCVGADANLDTVLNTLREKRLISLPVVDVTSRTCIGVIDVLDIVSFVSEKFPGPPVFSKETIENYGREILQNYSLRQILALIADRSKFREMSPVQACSTLYQLLTAFSMGIHRVPIVDGQLNIINFISQSDILQFFAAHPHLLCENGRQTLEYLGLCKADVRFAREDAIVIDALRVISSSRISALPILNVDGQLVATFSASDLRGIQSSDFVNLLLPVKEFLKIYSRKSLFPLTCFPIDTLEYVIYKIAATKVHRLWCVDDRNHLLGVLSITDVMKPFAMLKAMDIVYIR